MADDTQFAIKKPNLGIDGIVTAKMSDGSHYTYRLKTGKKGDWADRRVVSLLTGPDNMMSYTAFGEVITRYGSQHGIIVWMRCRGALMHHADILECRCPEVVGYLQSGKCKKCGRPLTDPISIAMSLGPVCRGGQ